MLHVQQQYFLHAHSSISVDVFAKASLVSISNIFLQDQTHYHRHVYYHAKLSDRFHESTLSVK